MMYLNILEKKEILMVHIVMMFYFSSSATKTQRQRSSRENLAKLFPVLEESVKYAVGVDIHDNRYYFDNTTKDIMVLLGAYKDEDYFVPIKYEIKNFFKGTPKLYVVVSQNKIEAEVVKTSARDVKPSDLNASRSASIVSISQLIKNVNPDDSGLLKYLPSEMLSDEQQNGKEKGFNNTTDNGVVYYVEAVTEKIGNEKLLINKQMVKTGLGYIPKLHGIKSAILKKQSEAEFLDDLNKIHEAYVQDEYQLHSNNSISESGEFVNNENTEEDHQFLGDENAKAKELERITNYYCTLCVCIRLKKVKQKSSKCCTQSRPNPL